MAEKPTKENSMSAQKALDEIMHLAAVPMSEPFEYLIQRRGTWIEIVATITKGGKWRVQSVARQVQ